MQFFSSKQGDPEVVNMAFRDLKHELDSAEKKLSVTYQYLKKAREDAATKAAKSESDASTPGFFENCWLKLKGLFSESL